MSLTKEEVKKRLLQMIDEIGEKNDDGYVYYNKDKLLNKLESSGAGKFKDYGFGKLLTFLQKELSVEAISYDKHRIPQSCFFSEKQAKQAKQSVVKRNQKQAGSTKMLDKPQPLDGSSHGCPKLTVTELKVKVYNMIIMLVEGGQVNQQKDQTCCSVPLEKLNMVWQKASGSYKFTDYKHGSFKKFLIEQCQLKPMKNDHFEIRPGIIKTELQNIERQKESIATASSSDTEGHVSLEDSSQCKPEESLPKQVDKGNAGRCLSDGGQTPDISDPSTVTVLHMDSQSNVRSQSGELPTVSATKPTTEIVLPETRIPQSRYVELLLNCLYCSCRPFTRIVLKWGVGCH